MYRVTWIDAESENKWEDFEEGELQKGIEELLESGVEEESIFAFTLGQAVLPLSVVDGTLVASY